MNATNSTDPFVFNGKIDRTPTVRPKVLFTTVKIEDSDYKNDLNGKYLETVAFAQNQPVYNELKDYEEGDSIRARGRIEHKTYKGKDVIQLVLTALNPSVPDPDETDNSHRDYATLHDLGLDLMDQSTNGHCPAQKHKNHPDYQYEPDEPIDFDEDDEQCVCGSNQPVKV